MRLSIFIVFIALLMLSSGCGLFEKKKFEDSDAYKELMKHQEETDKKLDSIRKQNFKQLNDSVNNSFRRDLDSLKRSTDSLEKELEKSIQNLKTNKNQ